MSDRLVVGLGISVAVAGVIYRPGFLETSVHARIRRALLPGAALCLAIYSDISDAGVLSVKWQLGVESYHAFHHPLTPHTHTTKFKVNVYPGY